MSVELQIQKIFDRAGAIKQSYRNALFSGGNYIGTKFWNLVDDANDEMYENDVKGVDMTNLDSNTLNPNIGSIMSSLIYNHSLYFGTTLGLNDRPPFEAYLNTVRWRVSEDFGDIYSESQGIRLSTQNYVFASTDNVNNILATITYNGTVANPKALAEYLGDTRLCAKVTTTITGGNFSVDITALNLNGDSIIFQGITLPSGTAVDSFTALGKQIVSSIVINSDTVTTLSIPNTTGYKVGGYLILVNQNALAPNGVEVVIITGVDNLTNTITVDKLVNTYPGADISGNNIIAYPGLHEIINIDFSSSGHTATGGAIAIVPMDDRVQTL